MPDDDARPPRCFGCGFEICACDKTAVKSDSPEYRAGLRDAAKVCRQLGVETSDRAYETAATAIETLLLDETVGRLSAGQLAAIYEVTRPRPHTDRAWQEQALSFVWGNLAISSDHKPSKDVFRKIAAERYGWTDADFDAWWAKRSERIS